MSTADKLVLVLAAQQVVIAGFYLVQGDWIRAAYWTGATVVVCASVFML